MHIFSKNSQNKGDNVQKLKSG